MKPVETLLSLGGAESATGATHALTLPIFRLSNLAIAAMVALFNFAVCCCSCFIFPGVPLLQRGDATVYLNSGARMVTGRLPYRDYFDFVAPGAHVTYALVIKVFGAHAWITNVMIGVLAAIAAFIMTLIAARLMNGFSLALPGLLLAGFVMPGALDATHHWFSTIAAMCAVLVLLDRETTTGIAFAGILCGITAWYTQSRGFVVVLGLVVYLLVKGGRLGASLNRRLAKCVVLCVIAVTVFFLGNVYFIHAAGLRRWWWCLVTFPLKYYGSIDVNNWHTYGKGLRGLGLGSISLAFVYATVPLVYIICFVILYRSKQVRNEAQQNAVLLVSIIGVAMFLSVISAPSGRRVSTVSPPAVILLTWILDRRGAAATKLKIGLGVAAICLAAAGAIRFQLRWSAFLDLPVGRTAFTSPAQYEEYRYAMTRMCCGQLVFGGPHLLFPLGLQNPAPIDIFFPFDYTRPEQVAETIRVLEQDRVQMLMLNPTMFEWPGMNHTTDHLAPMRAYLACRFRISATFQTEDQLWERVDHPGSCIPD